jgi:phosphoserine phosphatase RsbU/P
MNILILEDNVDCAYLISEILTNRINFINEYINIKILNSGNDLIKDVIEFKPDVILMDMLLPDKHGLEHIKDLKNIETTSDIPIIVITGLYDSEDVKKAMNSGCFEYIKKPIDKIELITKVKFANKFYNQNKKLKEYQLFANINESLIQAQRIQKSLFPDKERFRKSFENYDYLFIPKDVLSGDFIWIKSVDNKEILFVGDCTGHGLPAAMITVMGHTLLNKNINYRYEYTPSEILNYLTSEINFLLNSKDTYSIHDGMDGVCLLITDNIIEYSSAKLNILIVSKKKKIILNGFEKIPCAKNDEYNLFTLPTDRYSIGREAIDYRFINNRLKLQEGDRIYISTDGYYDQLGFVCGKKDVRLGKKKYYQILLNIQEYDFKIQKEKLYNYFKDYKGDFEQNDDITIFMFEI